MTTDNAIYVTGNVTDNPEVVYGQTGTARCKFTLAVERRRKVDGEWQSETEFVDVVAWRDLAEHIAESLTKGCRAVVAGRLSSREWTGRDGVKHNAVEVVADEVAASLKWVTVTVNRSERTPTPQAAPRPQEPVTVSSGSPRGRDDFGEEPF